MRKFNSHIRGHAVRGGINRVGYRVVKRMAKNYRRNKYAKYGYRYER